LNIADLITRAENNLHLTPKERAFLRVLKNLGQSAILIGLESAMVYLANPQKFDYVLILQSCALLALFAFINGLLHYLSSTQDTSPQVKQIATQANDILQPIEAKILTDGARGVLPTTSVMPIATVADTPTTQMPIIPPSTVQKTQ
jgi:hypothetical protein